MEISITYISPVLLLAAISIGVRNFSESNNQRRIITVFVTLSLLIDIISRYYVQLNKQNLILFNILSLVELISFLLFFYQVNKRKWVFLFSLFIGGIFVITEFIRLHDQSLKLFQSYSKALVAFLVVGLALNYIFTQIYREREVEDKLFNYGIIFYFSMEFILLLPLNYLINGKSEYIKYLWHLRISVIFIFYIIIIHYLWSHGKTKKQLQFG